jgi:hypothetical protein
MSVRLDRDVAARAIYDRRPFRSSTSESVMDPLACKVRELPFDDAPAFYTAECYELADAVIAALRLRDLRAPAALRVVA